MTGPSRKPRVLVVGDLVLDVVLVAARSVESGTDVPGRVEIRQGGSAATTARWLGRLGIDVQLACAVGRDGAGRSLVQQLERDGVTVRARRIAGSRTGRIGVLVAPGGERSFIQDRRAAELLDPEDLRADWFAGVDLVHLPVYSLMGEHLARTGGRAIDVARANGALVSIDLASIGPLLATGRRAARELISVAAPNLLFATESEAVALLGRYAADGLLEFADVAVIKRGDRGARVLARSGASAPAGTSVPVGGAAAASTAGATAIATEPATEPLPPLAFDVDTPSIVATDTTGAGDAFDAGFIAGWLKARADGRTASDGLHRATLAGHRAAARHLGAPRQELPPG